MLTTARAVRLELRMGFWCEAIASYPETEQTFWLGSHPAATPRPVMRWFRTRAGHIADQLDEPAAAIVRHWLTDQAEHEHALALLVNGELYAHTIHEDSLR
ncbi:hypothetical protein [Streptomyces millisiae]|uniref:Uncharacterized protein n=1 Tax=Streptomyces millisiae TaxID=3075542 RepID=A0ABU2LK68_9ACTN|nr:hypothetical protein [Streptomyces sp. DSM 44918]MDT0317978.1 hypothetical protein [Streptomyces sp. DSM 44918]